MGRVLHAFIAICAWSCCKENAYLFRHHSIDVNHFNISHWTWGAWSLHDLCLNSFLPYFYPVCININTHLYFWILLHCIFGCQDESESHSCLIYHCFSERQMSDMKYSLVFIKCLVIFRVNGEYCYENEFNQLLTLGFLDSSFDLTLPL